MLEITGDQRKASRDQAGDLWKEAADLGSGQAHYLLGMFYATAGDYESSWRHFEASAKANNPTGLAAAANILLFSDNYNTYKKNLPYREDQAQLQGRQYLDDSLKTGSPRAAYVRGRAMLEGRGNFKAETGSGLAEIEFAFCKNDEEAEKFFARPPRRKGPDCSETRPQAFGR
jgi:TPR repeat protein